MELTFNDLKKRDVINITDGRCLGRMTNLTLKFPQGVLTGIFVPGKKRGLFCFFDKSEMFIEVDKILKIGGDVILVDLRKDLRSPVIEQRPCPPQPCPPIHNPCAPICPPKPPCPPKNKNNSSNNGSSGGISASDFESAFNINFDEGDY